MNTKAQVTEHDIDPAGRKGVEKRALGHKPSAATTPMAAVTARLE